MKNGSPFKISECQLCVFTKKWVEEKEFQTFSNARDAALETIVCKLKWNASKMSEPPQVYFSELPISTAKYRDLNKLCLQRAIPKHHHAEYMNLKFSNAVKDCLVQPKKKIPKS